MTLFALTGGAEWIIIGMFLFVYAAAFYVLFRSIWGRMDIEANTKLLWTIFFVVAPVIALLVYALFGRKQMAKL